MPANGKVRGLFTALLTPFDQEGEVSKRALLDLVRFQKRSRVDGLYVCGTTGLGPLLSVEERKMIAETVIKESSGSLPVVVQVGCADTQTTIELARHAERAGADAVASLTPYYYRLGDDAVRKHFESVSEALTIPLFAYNIPQFTGNNLRPEMVADLARRGTVAGVKDSSRDVLQLLDLIGRAPKGFVVMNGTEEYGLFSLMMGGSGLISGGANVAPGLFTSLVSAHSKGDLKAAVEHQQRVLDLRDAVREWPIPAYYEILRSRGVDCGSPRAPFQPIRKNERDVLLAGLAKSGIPLGPANE